MRTISAADANRYFSRLLSDVKGGETVTITSHGEPVARMEPVRPSEDAKRGAAWDKLLTRLRSQPAMNLGRFNRAELYED